MKVTLKIALFFFLFLSVLIIKPTSSYAYWHGGHDRGYVGVHLGVWAGGPYYGYGYPYYPYDYPYYSAPYYAPSYPLVAATTYQPVVVNGVTYYVNNGAYYIYTQYGYQAVAAPVEVAAPAVQMATVTAAPEAANVGDDSITVNIPNNKGGYTAVVLKRSGNGFTGPQGEFYAEFPKVSQLQTMYGK